MALRILAFTDSGLAGTTRRLPSHRRPPIRRGLAGPSLLILVNEFLLHQPWNRQSQTAFGAHEMDSIIGSSAIHADDTTVLVLAKLRTVPGRIWTYVRDSGHLAVATHRRRCSITRAVVPGASARPSCRPCGPDAGRRLQWDNDLHEANESRRSLRLPVGARAD